MGLALCCNIAVFQKLVKTTLNNTAAYSLSGRPLLFLKKRATYEHTLFAEHSFPTPNQEAKECALNQTSLNVSEFSQGSKILIDAAA